MRRLIKTLSVVSITSFVIGAGLIALGVYLDRLMGPPGEMMVIRWKVMIPLLTGALCSSIAILAFGVCGVLWIITLLQKTPNPK